MAVNKGDLYRLIEQLNDPVEIEIVYRAIKSILKHDDQAWYWTEAWQQGEREADEDIQRRRVSRPFDNEEELFKYLDRVAKDED